MQNKVGLRKIISTQDNYRFSNEKTYIGNTNFGKTKTSTTDVTDAVKAISTAGQGYIIFNGQEMQVVQTLLVRLPKMLLY